MDKDMGEVLVQQQVITKPQYYKTKPYVKQDMGEVLVQQQVITKPQYYKTKPYVKQVVIRLLLLFAIENMYPSSTVNSKRCSRSKLPAIRFLQVCGVSGECCDPTQRGRANSSVGGGGDGGVDISRARGLFWALELIVYPLVYVGTPKMRR